MHNFSARSRERSGVQKGQKDQSGLAVTTKYLVYGRQVIRLFVDVLERLDTSFQCNTTMLRVILYVELV
jgi:hypothetical protein